MLRQSCCFPISHVSAYTILENIRLALTDRLMKAPLGVVLGRSAGQMKNILVDRVETIELPLAHMIPEGSFTALVGPSGGGKSTVAHLLARFWDVASGSIRIGGVDIKAIPLTQLEQNIAFVTQDNYLFGASLFENIRVGKPDASDVEVLAAAKAAQCEEFISRLEHGWNTTAGEAGKQLYGGELLRISIARAMLKNAPIVILDEATASVDPENEHHIQQAITALTKGKTIVAIAHRLATIEHADQIFVVEDGRISQRGTHKELLRKNGTYKRFVDIRKKAEGWKIA